ncbi:MAG: hypothetical protein SNJ77_10895 [Cytophagales bacterium]
MQCYDRCIIIALTSATQSVINHARIYALWYRKMRVGHNNFNRMGVEQENFD